MCSYSCLMSNYCINKISTINKKKKTQLKLKQIHVKKIFFYSENLHEIGIYTI